MDSLRAKKWPNSFCNRFDIWIELNVCPSSKPLSAYLSTLKALGLALEGWKNLTDSTLIPIKNRKSLSDIFNHLNTWSGSASYMMRPERNCRQMCTCTEFSSNENGSSKEHLIWHSHCDLCVWIVAVRATASMVGRLVVGYLCNFCSKATRLCILIFSPSGMVVECVRCVLAQQKIYFGLFTWLFRARTC